MCVLPLLLAGVLGAPSNHEQLVEYLRKLLVERVADQSTKCNAEIVDAVRFLWLVKQETPFQTYFLLFFL